MIRTLFALFLFANAAWAACTKISMPTDYAVVTNGTRANLKANFTETQIRVNPCMDSVDEVRSRLSGYSSNLLVTSLENLRLRLDGDASTTAKFLLETSNGDSLFRVSEDSSAKFFGSLAAVNGSFSGTLGVTGVGTFTAAPVFSSATASQAMFTNGSKALVSNAITGSGNVVMSTSPTLVSPVLGVASATSLTTTGTIGIGTSVSSTIPIVAWGPTYSSSAQALEMRTGQGAGSNGDYVFLQPAHWRTDGTNSNRGGSIRFTAVDLASGTRTAKVGIYGCSGASETQNLGVEVGPSGAVTMPQTLAVTGTVTADSVIAAKNFEEGSFTATLRGCASDPTGTAYYVRVNKQVTLSLPYLTCTADSAGAAVTGLPSSIQPTRAQGFPVNLMENGTLTQNTSSGLVVSGSAVRFYIGASPTSLFSASGTRSLYGNMFTGGMTTITYLLN